MLSTKLALGLLLAITLRASSLKHHLFVSNLSPPASLYALEFDDETLDLRITNNMTADAPHSWITFNVRPPLTSSPYSPTNPPYSTTRQTYTAPPTSPPASPATP